MEEQPKRKRIFKSQLRSAVNAGMKQAQLAHKGCIETKYFGSLEKRIVGALITTMLHNKEKIEEEVPITVMLTEEDILEVQEELQAELYELVENESDPTVKEFLGRP